MQKVDHWFPDWKIKMKKRLHILMAVHWEKKNQTWSRVAKMLSKYLAFIKEKKIHTHDIQKTEKI